MAAGSALSPSRKLRRTRDERLVLYRIATRQTHTACRPATRTMHCSPVSNLTAFRLENYKHEQKMDLLEKEKKQCKRRFKEDKHIFKMSAKLPTYMEKYGGKFKANGELYRCNSGSSRSIEMNQQNVKKHQSSSIHRTKTPKQKPVKCKTVKDLIALMRSVTPSDETSGEQTPTSAQTSRTKNSSRNDNLRLLLENYEVFVPKDDLFGVDDEEKDETASKLDLHEQKRPHSEDPAWSLHKMDDEIDKECSRVRSKSAQTADERLKLPVGSKSEIKFRLHSPKCSPKKVDNARREPLRPTVRQVVTEYVNRVERPREYFWNSPSKRLDNDLELPQDEQEITEGRETRHYEPFQDESIRQELIRDESIRQELIRDESIQQESILHESIRQEWIPHESFRHDPHSRHRVSFASMADIDSCQVDEHLMNYDATISLNLPHEDLDENKLWKLYENASEIKETEQSRNKKWKVNGKNQKKDTEEEFPSTCKLKNHLKHLIQEKTTKHGQKQERLEEELPIKVFNPQFPVEYRKVKQINLNKHTPKTTTAAHSHATSRATHKSVSSPYSDRSAILNELDHKYTGVKECRQLKSEQLAPEGEKGTPSSTKMIIFGKGLQRVDEKDRQAQETRQKMDQFFARLHSTTSQQSTINIPKNRPNTAVLVPMETEVSQEEQNDYKRATPWPVQIWC